MGIYVKNKVLLKILNGVYVSSMLVYVCKNVYKILLNTYSVLLILVPEFLFCGVEGMSLNINWKESEWRKTWI